MKLWRRLCPRVGAVVRRFGRNDAAGVCRIGELVLAPARREHHPAISSLAGKAQAGAPDPSDDQRRVARQGLMVRTGTVVDATLTAAPCSADITISER